MTTARFFNDDQELLKYVYNQLVESNNPFNDNVFYKDGDVYRKASVSHISHIIDNETFVVDSEPPSTMAQKLVARPGMSCEFYEKTSSYISNYLCQDLVDHAIKSKNVGFVVFFMTASRDNQILLDDTNHPIVDYINFIKEVLCGVQKKCPQELSSCYYSHQYLFLRSNIPYIHASIDDMKSLHTNVKEKVLILKKLREVTSTSYPLLAQMYPSMSESKILIDYQKNLAIYNRTEGILDYLYMLLHNTRLWGVLESNRFELSVKRYKNHKKSQDLVETSGTDTQDLVETSSNDTQDVKKSYEETQNEINTLQKKINELKEFISKMDQ